MSKATPRFEISTRKNKKYKVTTPRGKVIHFGHTDYQQFRDSTPIKAFKHLNHGDKKRQDNYLKRAKGITDKYGNLTWKDPEFANYYSIKYLW